MSRRSASLVAVVSLLSAAVGTHARAATATKLAPKIVLTLPSSGEYPEGIAVDPSSKRIYVTSLTNGAIFVASKPGQTMKTFSPAGSGGRASAVGIVVNGRRVLVAGGGSGVLYAYDRAGKSLFAAKTPDEGSFLNDIVVSGGFAYVTDSFKPIVWRAPVNSSGELALEPWLDLSTQGVTYIEKTFNWNGIEATSVPGVLVAVDSASGALFRVDTITKTATKVDLGTDTVVNGDGLVVRGTSLWVVRNADREVAEVTMNQDWTNGSVSVLLQSDLFGFPTTADIVGKQMLVVNSQFDKGGPVGPGTPTRPFSVSAIPLNRKK